MLLVLLAINNKILDKVFLNGMNVFIICASYDDLVLELFHLSYNNIYIFNLKNSYIVGSVMNSTF